jgi:hypothetical protein
MSQLLLTDTQLRGLMVSAARKGFAHGSGVSGARTMSSSLASIDATIEGLLKTNNANQIGKDEGNY